MAKIPWHSHEVEVLETLGAAGSGVWDDLRFPATAINPPGQASDPDVEATTGLLLFDSVGVELIFAFVQMPHAWLEGDNISPHVHWQKTTSAAGNVLWRIRYRMAPINEVMDAAYSDYDGSATPITQTPDVDTADHHMISSFTEIDMTDRQISDCIVFEISRDPTDDLDTYGADARLLEFDIHYRSDSNGSFPEFSKQTRPFDL